MSKEGDEVVEKKVKRSVLTRRKQRAFGDSLREWLQERAVAAEKRSKEAAEERKNKPRGVDRVPVHLQESNSPAVRSVTANTDDNYAARRATAVRFGSRDERGNWHKAPMRPGSNTPHVNPDRDNKRRR